MADICDFFHSHDYPCGQVTSKRIHHVAHAAMLLPQELVHDLLDYLQLGWQRYQLLSLELVQLRKMVQRLVPNTPAAVLTTVPDIGPFLAAGYLAYVLDASRFRRADQIWSLAGFDVEQEESGDASYRAEISRRGNPGFRNILYLIGFETSQRCPSLQRTKQLARQRGLGPVGAVVHVALRANRICFRLLRDQISYQAEIMESTPLTNNENSANRSYATAVALIDFAIALDATQVDVAKQPEVSQAAHRIRHSR